jgi:hypothetical protein
MQSSSEHNDEISSLYLQEDVNLVAKWAREDLFRRMKFLYRGKEDLKPTGMVFDLFVKQCSDKFQGVMALEENGENSKETYVRLVWEMATKKQTLSAALSLRRSCVYTVMLNRFNGMY